MAERSTFFSRLNSTDQASSAASPAQSRSARDTRCQRPLDKRRNRREMAAATCGICLEAVSEQGVLQCRQDSGMMEQACAHAFCFTCVITWAKRTNTCPMCKARFNAVHRAPHQTAHGIGETVEVEDKDPIVDNESGDEHLAAELAVQEGEGSAVGDSDLEDADPLLESETQQRRRQDMPGHGYVMDDFVVDDDEVEMEGEDESSSGSDEEWQESPVAATAGRTGRTVAAAAVGSRTSTRTNDSRSASDRRRRGLLDAFAPGLDEEEEEVYFSAQTGFGRRPTGRRAAAMSEAMGTNDLGPPRGEEILPNELRQLQREAARVVGGSPLRPRRRPPPRSSFLAAVTGSTPPALSRRSTTSIAASASLMTSPLPVGRRSEQRGASGTSSGSSSGDVDRFGQEASKEVMSRLRGEVVGSSGSPCRRPQRRRPALRSLANTHSNGRGALETRARGTTITADDDSNDSDYEQRTGTEWFTSAGDREVRSNASAETLFVSGASSHRSSGVRNSAGASSGRGSWERSLPGRSVPQRPRTAIGRARTSHGRVLAGEPGQWISRRRHGTETSRYADIPSETRAGSAAPHRSRGLEQSNCATAAARAEIATKRTCTDRSGGNRRIRNDSTTTAHTPQHGSSGDDNDDDDSDCDGTSKSSAAEGVTARIRRTRSGGSASGSVSGILRPRLRRRSSLGDGGCRISDSDSEEEWMAKSPSVKLSAERNSERSGVHGTARAKSSSINKAGDRDARADARSLRCKGRKTAGDSSDVEGEEEEAEFEWQNTAPSAVESVEADTKESEFDDEEEQPTSSTLPRKPLNTRLLQRRQPRDGVHAAAAAAAAAATRLSSIANKDSDTAVSVRRGARLAMDVDREQEKTSASDVESDPDDDDDSFDDEHFCWSQPRTTTPERVVVDQRMGTGVQRCSVGEKRDRETDAGEGERRKGRKARKGDGGGGDHELSHPVSAPSRSCDSSGTGTTESPSGTTATDDDGDDAQSVSAFATTSWFDKFRFKGSSAAPRKC